MAQNDWMIELGAILSANAEGDLQKSINNIKDLSVRISKAELSPDAIQHIKDQLTKNGIDLKLVFGNANQYANQARQVGQQVGKLISDEANKAINNVSSPGMGKYFKIDTTTSKQFKTEIKNLVSEWTNAKGELTDIKIDTRTVFDEDAGRNIERLHQATVTYKNELDEVIKKTIAWRQIGVTQDDKGNDVPLRGFVEVAAQYKKSIDEISVKTDNFISKQKTAVSNFTNQINQVNRAANDKNTSRPISDTNLKNLETEYKNIITEIDKMKTLSGEAFVDQQIKVSGLISNFKSLVSEYRNMDNVSTKMKGTDFSSGLKIAENDLAKFKADAKDFPQIVKTIDNLDTAIKNVGDSSSLNAFNDQLRIARTELAKIKAETTGANRSEKVKINAFGLQSKITDLQKISPEINKFETEINGAKVSVSSLVDELVDVKTQSDFSVVNSKWRAFVDAAKAAGIAVRDIGTSSETSAEKIKNIQTALNRGDYSAKLSNLEASYKRLGFTSDEIETRTRAVSDALQKLRGGNLDTLIQDEQAFNDALKTSQNQLVRLKNDLTQVYNPTKQTKLSTDIQNWLSKNTKASKDAKQSLQEYYRELSGGRANVDRLNYIESELKRIDATQRGLGRLGKSLKDQFKQAGASFSQWLSVSSAVMLGVQKTKEAVRELKELDNILTEISKTSDLTTSQLKKLGDTAFETASQYGKKASDYLTGVQEMYRAGFDNAEEMAKLSLLAQSAGDMDATSANNYLMATNAAYKYKGSVEELNKVLDGQNYITNNAAISMKDISDATSETASVAAQYGVQINELSALIATATANTRESGSEVGTALKAIMINLQDTTSKPVTETFNSLGISMTKVVDGAERLKTPIELIYELAEAYNSLPEGDVMRANILNEIGQKRHANTLASILSDMKGFEDMLDLYSNSSASGSALREAEKSANNLQGSLNKLSNTWTNTVENIANSDGLKTAVNTFNWLLTGVNKLTDALGSLGSIGLGAGIFAGFKNFGRPKMFGLKLLF